MSKIMTVLFDFDGVVANTEPLYDTFWYRTEQKYKLGIPDFPARIKGTTLRYIFETYFSGFPVEETEKITLASAVFEQEMDFPEIPGAIRFLHILKAEGYKLGLVTSSSLTKMKLALKKMNLESVFDTMVTADRIIRGKPDPMCYLLAARDLDTPPEGCVVFEDAFTGIRAATAAGMRVVGLATTNPAEAIQDKVSAVIPDFKDAQKVLSLILK